MTRTFLEAIVGLMMILGGSGCGSSYSSPSAPTGPPPAPVAVPSLKMKSISPPLGTLLPHGQVTQFQATLAYDLATASSGSVGTVTAGIANGALVFLGGIENQPVHSQAGEVTLNFSLNLPDSAAGIGLQAGFSLYAPGGGNALVSFNEPYKVAP